MPAARLHDGATVDVRIIGDGPTVLVPVNTAIIKGAAADQMRAWGADPNLGRTLADGLADVGFRVVAADYEGHLAAHPKPATLTAGAVAADLLTIADAAERIGSPITAIPGSPSPDCNSRCAPTG